MKKFLSLFFVICLIIPCATIFSACGARIEIGKDYVLFDVKILWASEEEKSDILNGRTEQQLIETYLDQTKITFNNDDSVIFVTPAQNGNEEKTIKYYYTKNNQEIILYSDEEKQNEVDELAIVNRKIIRKGKLAEDKETLLLFTYTL